MNRELWEINTFILTVQAIYGGVAYLSTGDVTVAATAASAAALVLVITAPTSTAALAALSALAATAIIALIGFAAFSAKVLIALAVFAFATPVGAAIAAEKEGFRQPFWLLCLLAMPGGIGTVVGGLLLLARKE